MVVDYNPYLPCPGGKLFVDSIVGGFSPFPNAGMAYRTFVKP
jgi:hypothetical protein